MGDGTGRTAADRGGATVLVAGYEALRSAAAAFPLGRDFLEVTGTDAVGYLQGQCSQDVASLQVGGSSESLILSPQGKIDGYVRVSRLGASRLVIDTDPGAGPVVRDRLERFRIRVDVHVSALDWVCVAVRGPQAETVVSEASGTWLRLPVSWPGLEGVDLVGPAEAVGGPDVLRRPVPWCSEEAWEAARIEAGIPRGGAEILPTTIPAEVHLVERTVSFTKGCFTGQELVARLDARGSKVVRRLCGLVLPADAGVPVGLRMVPGLGTKETGSVTSVAWSPRFGSAVGLAVIHRRVTTPGEVLVAWESSDGPKEATARVQALPLVT